MKNFTLTFFTNKKAQNYCCLIFALLFFSISSWSQTYTQVTTGSLVDGVYLIVGDGTNDGMMINTTTTATPYINYSAVTNPGASITIGYSTANDFQIVVTSGVVTIYNASVGYVSWGRTGNNTGNSADFYNGTVANTEKWTATVASGLWTLSNVGTPARLLQWNQTAGSQRFACYTTNQIKLKLYKKENPTQVATPTISFSGTPVATDTYLNTTNATLTATSGATIYYTTDGSTPTTSSTVYSAPFAVSTTTTIKTFAVKSGLTDSGIVSKTITVVYPPANDLCGNAIALIASTSQTNGTLAYSTVTSPFTDKVDVWYKITPTYNETYTFTTGNFSGDVDVYLYSQSNACPTTTSYVTRAFTSNIPEVFTSVLTSGLTYYIRVVADNPAAQNAFTIQVTAPASPISAPVANVATNILQTQFNANWETVNSASDGYLLDVSTSPTFGSLSPLTVTEGFETGLSGSYQTGTVTLTTGVWSVTNVLAGTTGVNNGSKSAQLQSATGSELISPSFANGVSTLTFYVTSSISSGAIQVNYSTDNGDNWIAASNSPFTGLNTTKVQKSVTVNTTIPTLIQIIRTAGTIYIDDVVINTYSLTPSFVTGYNAKQITGQSTITSLVNGLTENTQYYYRLRAKSGSVISDNSNTISVKTKPSSVTWTDTGWSNTIGPDADIDAVIQFPYSTSILPDVTFVANNLTIASGGSLTVKSGTSIAVEGNLVNNLTADKVIVESNADLLQGGTENNNTGAITVIRNSAALKRLDYTLWSSPVTGQGLYAFSPTTLPNRFYVYNSVTDKYNSVEFNLSNLQYPSPLVSPNGINGTDNKNVEFETAKGYMIRAPWDHPTTPTKWVGNFKGIPNNGDIALTVEANKFYGIGNPYPSTILADSFIDENDIAAALYFWRKTNNTDQATNPTTSYATFTKAGGTGTSPNTQGNSSIVPNGIIQVGQGFIVKSTSTTLKFTNSMRTANHVDQFLKTKEVEKNRIWINLTTASGAFNQMMVAYMTGATQGIDAAIDGKYFNDSTTALNSLLNNEEYAIQGRALPFVGTDVVPLVFKTDVAGSYIISLDHVDGLFLGNQDVFLNDKIIGAKTNLKTGNYNFTSEAGNFTNRFEITYQTALSVNPPVFNENSIIVYKQNQDLIINTGTTIMSNLKVYDLQGRLLVDKKSINATETKITTVAKNQILLLKITFADNGSVTKKVMN